MSMTKRAAKAVYMSKVAVDGVSTTAKDFSNGVLMATFLGASGLGLGIGALTSKASSPTDVDMDNARKEYRSNSLDAAIAELTAKLRNERMAMEESKGTKTMQKAMRLV